MGAVKRAGEAAASSGEGTRAVPSSGALIVTTLCLGAAMDMGGALIAFPPMGMAVQMNLGRNNVQIAVPHAALGDNAVRKNTNIIGRPTQDHRLQAGVVIQMNVQSRQADVMVVVLALGQPSRQFAFIVIEDVGQAADAIGGGSGFQPFAFQFFPDDVANSLGPVQIAFSGHELVKLGEQFVVERDGDSFHLPRRPFRSGDDGHCSAPGSKENL